MLLNMNAPAIFLTRIYVLTDFKTKRALQAQAKRNQISASQIIRNGIKKELEEMKMKESLKHLTKENLVLKQNSEIKALEDKAVKTYFERKRN